MSASLSIEDASAAEYPAVERFYERLGYHRGIQPQDRVLVAREEGALIGVVRLCEEEGVVVLRGMYVDTPRRRTGVGTALLRAVEGALAGRECWCIPWAHLTAFYARAGFAEAEADAPPHLARRLGGYRTEGRAVTLMRRPAAP